jgi:dTDP-4-dehydrorhamnose 3,5-epimerase
MIFKQTAIEGTYLIEIERREDERGFFARAWCKSEFEAHGLNADFVQANLVVTRRKGTLRGLHYQIAPFEEAKLVRCARGAIFDVIVDLRPDSPTYGRWSGVELKAETYRMIYVPEGCGHGYQALSDDAEVFYQVSQVHAPEAEQGVRCDDPVFAIEWPLEPVALSGKDRAWPNYVVAAGELRAAKRL